MNRNMQRIDVKTLKCCDGLHTTSVFQHRSDRYFVYPFRSLSWQSKQLTNLTVLNNACKFCRNRLGFCLILQKQGGRRRWLC